MYLSSLTIYSAEETYVPETPSAPAAAAAGGGGGGGIAPDLLKEIKSDDELKSIPFVMVTAEAQKDNIVMAVKAGVSNYIVKPFTAETVSEKLKKIFGG